MIRNLLQALAITMAATTAPAGAVEVTLEPRAFEISPPPVLKKATASVDGGTIDEHSAEGFTRHFDLTLPTGEAVVTLQVGLDAAGAASYQAEFEVPYGAGNLDLAPTVVLSTPPDQAAEEFVDTAINRVSLKDAFGIQQRARVLFEARRRLTPGTLDVGIAFLLVRSTAKLISNAFITIDPTTADATVWLSGEMVANSQRFRNFLEKERIDATEVTKQLDAVKLRNRTVRGTLIRYLEDDATLQSTYLGACARLPDLRRRFEDESHDPDTQYSGWNYQRTLMLSASLTCVYQDLIVLKKGGS